MKFNIRKVFILIFILIISVILTGCVKTIRLTNRESDMIAEYAAGTLLKYSKNYENRLISIEEIEKESENSIGNEEEILSKKETIEKELAKDIEEDEYILDKFNDIFTRMINIEGIEVNIKDYEIIDSYQKGDNIILASMYSKDFTDYIKFNFDIKNNSDEEIKVDLLNNKIKYNLKIDKKYYQALLTIFPEDISNFNDNLSARSVTSTSLFFEVNEDFNQENITLEIKKDNNNIALKCLSLEYKIK